jgi:hypothetical protein
MDEMEWLESTDPDRMLTFLGRKANPRRRRLFACACYRHVPSLIVEQRCLNAVMVSERYADGMASKEELSKALNGAFALLPRHWPSSLPTARYAEEVREVAAHASQDGLSERRYQAGILRCLWGNPFRPTSLDHSWFTPTVKALAQAIYEDRSFTDLPVLADALEEAGCNSQDILSHLRGPGPHTRGCWAVDIIILGKVEGHERNPAGSVE